MRFLLDTHIVYWARVQPHFLPPHIADTLLNPNYEIYYSVICPWELAIKEAKKKIHLPEAFFSTFADTGFDVLAITDKHVEALRKLPRLHGDPFDRMLAAQAASENMTLITHDKRLASYPVRTIVI